MGHIADDVSWEIKLAKHKEIKASIKERRKAARQEGTPLTKDSNSILSDVLGVGETYAKRLTKVAEGPDCDEIAKKLDAGENINAATTGTKRGFKLPKSDTPKACEVPAEYDISILCPECPKRQEFLNELESRQTI